MKTVGSHAFRLKLRRYPHKKNTTRTDGGKTLRLGARRSSFYFSTTGAFFKAVRFGFPRMIGRKEYQAPSHRMGGCRCCCWSVAISVACRANASCASRPAHPWPLCWWVYIRARAAIPVPNTCECHARQRFHNGGGPPRMTACLGNR